MNHGPWPPWMVQFMKTLSFSCANAPLGKEQTRSSATTAIAMRIILGLLCLGRYTMRVLENRPANLGVLELPELRVEALDAHVLAARRRVHEAAVAGVDADM